MSISGTLTERAMLVDLSISMLVASKTDKQISRDVSMQHGASDDAGRYAKNLFSKDEPEWRELATVAGQARAYHYENTSPWLDSGARILPSLKFLDYQNVMSDFVTRFNAAKDKFVAAYPRLINERARALNGMFNPADYPPVASIGNKFALAFRVFPMPSAEDFRVDLGDDVVAALKAQTEQDITDALQNSLQDSYQRIAKTVGHMSTKLSEYKVTSDGVEHPFRDSLVDNVRDLANLLSELNVAADPTLDGVIGRIRGELLKHGAATLRADDKAREEVTKSADAILADISTFMSAY